MLVYMNRQESNVQDVTLDNLKKVKGKKDIEDAVESQETVQVEL